MKVKKLLVKKLYGAYDYEINFNEDVTFLYGENGCGKTTILKILSAIITTKLYKLFELEFNEITLFYGEANRICVRNDGEDKKRALFIEFLHNGKFINEKISDYSEEFSKNAIVDENVMLIKYRNMFPLLKELGKIFNIAYLPLDRTHKLDMEFSYDDGYMHSSTLYRINRLNELKMGKGESISMVQINDMILNRYNRINRELEYINNKFRNDILKSFSEVYNIDDAETSFRAMFHNKQDIINKIERIKTAYIDILEELNILKDIDLNRYQKFFDEFIEDVRRMDLYRNSVEDTERFLMMFVKYQEFNRLESIVNLASDIEERREKIKKPLNDFLDIVNSFIMSNSDNKEIKIAKDGKLYLSIGNKRRVDIEKLSSGEKQIMIFFAYLIINMRYGQNSIFIVDEPEMSLHLYWQKIFVDSILKANPNIQVVFATHAPEIIGIRTNKMVKVIRKEVV